ncbi:hypothetical protein F5X96DRAFT_647018 [Biscogniauxia mediterranea]|nr:hypothetical protein F5X96DRAFT_647018 [Biscogniauxia mediterranea]
MSVLVLSCLLATSPSVRDPRQRRGWHVPGVTRDFVEFALPKYTVFLYINGTSRGPISAVMVICQPGRSSP